MTKSILISIRPEWTAKILNGEKTLEIRKSAPQCKKLPATVYIYCTKAKTWREELRVDRFDEYHLVGNFVKNHEYAELESESLNGRVVAKFTLRKVSALNVLSCLDDELVKKSCLSSDKIADYLSNSDSFGRGKGDPLDLDGFNPVDGFAWHIDDLQIFDEPMELSDFTKAKEYHGCDKCVYNGPFPSATCWACSKYEETMIIKRAPQSWMYVEVRE